METKLISTKSLIEKMSEQSLDNMRNETINALNQSLNMANIISQSKTKEQFVVHHNRGFRFRNKLERWLTHDIQALLKEPVEYTIEEIRAHFQAKIDNWEGRGGKGVRLSEITRFSCYQGAEHIMTRSFRLYGRGRKICTLWVRETVMKDSLNNYEPYEKKAPGFIIS